MPDLLIDNGLIIDDWDSGIDFLGTVVVNNLLNLVTTALYSPDFGTKVKTFPQQNIGDQEFEMMFSMIINEMETRIKGEQEETPGPPDEMLDHIMIRQLYKDATNRWQAHLRVYALTSQYFDITQQLT